MGWVKRIIGETSENKIIGQKKSIIHQGLIGNRVSQAESAAYIIILNVVYFHEGGVT